MANSREAKIKFSAETREFTQQIQSANATIASMRAGLKLNAAEMQNAGATAENLAAKHRLLSEQVEANRQKQEALSAKVAAAVSIYGENSREAQQWTTKLTAARTEEENLKKALSDCEKEMDDQRKATEELQSPLGRLTAEISGQKDKLAALKKEYANAVLSQGKDSDAAKALEAQIDSLNRELAENEGRLREAGAAAERAGEQASSSRDGWSVVGQVAANLATQGVQMLVGKLKEAAVAVINLGKDFTSSLSNVKALSGATSGEMKKLETAAKELGRTTVFSASQVSDAFGYMALAGWDTADMLDGIDGVLNLAAASGMELAAASDMVTDYLTAFGLSAKDSARFVDQIAYAMANSNTSAEQLGAAYKNCASTASSMGISVEDTTAALMVMANAGIKGGEAGTGLNTIMTRIATNASDATLELEKYGVEVYDANGRMNDLSSILSGTARVWGTLTGEQQAALAKTVAGTNQYSKFTAIMAGLSEEAQKGGQSFTDYATALEACDGAAGEMSSTMQDNLEGDLAALNSAMEGLGLQIFSFFEDGLRGAAQLATSAINAITDAITPAETTIGRFLGEVEETIKTSQQSLQNAKNAIEMGTSNVAELEAYRDILVDLTNRTDLNEFEQYQLKAAVEALASSVPGLAENFDEARGVLNLTNDELSEMFDNAEALAMQQALIDAQAESYKALAEAKLAQAKADSAVNAAQKEYDAWLAKNSHSARTSANDWGEYGAQANAAGQELLRAKRAQDEANKAMSEAEKQIRDEDAAYADLREKYGLATSSIKEAEEAQKAEKEAIEETKEAVDGFGEMTAEEMEAAEKAAEEVRKAYEDMKEGIAKSIENSISLTQEFSGGTKISADEILKNLQSQIKGVSKWAENMKRLGDLAGNGMAQSLYDHLVEMGPQSANLVQTLVDTLENDRDKFDQISKDWVEAMGLEGEASTLSKLHSTGKLMADSVADGVSSGAEGVSTAMQGVMNGLVQAADAGMARLKQSLGQTIQGPVVQNASVSPGANLNIGQWHAEGAVFSKPTLVPAVSGWHGVGDAGPEAVSPVSVLQDYVSAAVDAAMDRHDIDYDRLAESVAAAVSRMPTSIELDGRQLGRAVRRLT